MIWAYLRNRLSERLTWVGIAFAVVAGLVFVFYRQEVLAAVNALVGSTIAALPDRILHKSLFAPETGSGTTPAAIPVATTRSIKMSVFSDVTDVIEKASVAAVEAFVTNSALGVEEKAAVAAVLAAYQSPSITTALTAFEDVLKVVSDLKAQVAAASAPAAEQPAV